MAAHHKFGKWSITHSDARNRKTELNLAKLAPTTVFTVLHTNSEEHRGPTRGKILWTNKQMDKQTALEYIILLCRFTVVKLHSITFLDLHHSTV